LRGIALGGFSEQSFRSSDPRIQSSRSIDRAMKKIEAIIKPYKLDAIKTVLAEVGVDAMTATEVRLLKTSEMRRGRESSMGLDQPRIKIEIVMIDELVEVTLSAIAETMKASRCTEAEIFVSSINDAVRIRTGERGGGVVAHLSEQ
jgi:nitrogen regulatory protein P-II 1